MDIQPLIFTCLIILSPVFSNYFSENNTDFVSAFNKLNSTPNIIDFSNDLEINNAGGHLQGIQLYENNSGRYLFVSGSSDTYSYCSVIKLGVENKVISVNKLMDVPFKHAGGFQIFQNYLAVGIEDNTIKDKSKVCIYDISNPENQLTEPVEVIERNGEIQRSTAGCVGLTNYKNGILMAVGDWDTKHIDFYFTESDNLVDSGFKLIGFVDTEKFSKTGWIDNKWLSYQNINLLNIMGKLYLIGLGQNKLSENVADLFEINEINHGNFTFKKVAAKMFNCTNECSFKAGAGVDFRNGKPEIIVCGYNISNTSFINAFSLK